MSIPLIIEELQDVLRKRREAKKTRRPSSDEVSMFTLAANLQKPRSTTIVALEYARGVIMAGDRLTIEGFGLVFSRTSVKLDDIQLNAVMGTCGWSSFAQAVVQDIQFMCGVISTRIKRPVSLEGKCNLLKDVVTANLVDEQWWRCFDVSFGAIMGGFDRHSGAMIASFDTEGGVYQHQNFFADGSGRREAKSYLDYRYNHRLGLEKAVTLAIGAVRQAGKYQTSVSHPLDPPPTVKVISRAGIQALPERLVQGICHKMNRDEVKFLGRRKKEVSR